MTKPLTGNLYSFSFRGMRSNNPRTANAKLYAVLLALARRVGQEGFPIEAKFETPEEIADYFSGERVICLRCGNPYKSLAYHLKRIHGWTAEEYKEFYGLPWRRGLDCAETKGVKSENGTLTMAAGKGIGGMSVDERNEARVLAHKAKHRPRNPAAIVRARRLVVANAGHEIFNSEDFYKVLRRMVAEDKIASELFGVDGLPKQTTFYAFRRSDAAFDRAYQEAVEALSFAAQSRGQLLGARFRAEALRLRNEGNTIQQAADMLGVSYQTVINNTVGDWVKPPLADHCGRGHPKQPGKPCRICNTEDARRKRGSLPREISARTLIPSNCADCGTEILVNRLRGLKRARRCAPCHAKHYHEYHANYRAKLKKARSPSSE